MTYVEDIEPRLTPHREVTPATCGEALIEWVRDLEQELLERLRRISEEDMRWQPHPDSNCIAVTVWHIARWLDILATRALGGGEASAEIWRCHGWSDRAAYDPVGLGYLGLGTLTGYSAQEMRGVPSLGSSELASYVSEATAALVAAIDEAGDRLHRRFPNQATPYQAVSSTVQGSFGHVGEIDALVALRHRLAQPHDAR